jgi:hypothetical protein
MLSVTTPSPATRRIAGSSTVKIRSQAGTLASKDDEHRLRDFFGQMFVPHDAHRCAMHHARVAFDQRPKRLV